MGENCNGEVPGSHRGMGIAAPNESIFFVFLCIFLLQNEIDWCSAVDFISPGESLSGKRTITSIGAKFELGFYPSGSSHKFYLGIWYNSIPNKTVVWTANRDKPLLDATSELKLLDNGTLALFGNSVESPIWSTNSKSATNSTVAVLLDTGNLVLRHGSNSSAIIWQSFDNPTDTWLPGSRLGLNKLTGEIQSITSWISLEDPSPGTYSFGINPNGSNQCHLWWKRSHRYWNSGDWNGKSFTLAPELGLSMGNNIYSFEYTMNENESYFTYSVRNSSLFSRLVLNLLGQIQHWTWVEEEHEWALDFAYPRDPCEVYSLCGVFSECSSDELAICKCLNGFVPESEQNWVVQNRTGGCVRRTALQCGANDGFLLVTGVKRFPNNSLPLNLRVLGARECELACLNDCSCVAYAFSGECLVWNGELQNLRLASGVQTNIYIRLPASDVLQFTRNTRPGSTRPLISKMAKRKLKIIGGVNGSLIILLGGIFMGYIWTKKRREKKKKNKLQYMLSFDVGTTASNKLKAGKKKVHKLPFYNFETIASATNNFSAASKLGEGGFGPVYKGKLLNEDEIAVKRLSNSSIQGLEEFKNEITLISELQHVNLVRLLGCCIQDEEKILIYEYMPNKSLDSFLFDPIKKALLIWEQRSHIIDGITQGLLYLHKYSRLKIIHRDLKASNILLDGDLNPKISDFGMARIHGDSQSKVNTNRVAGTYGYMAPEYAAEGIFSVKSDVFSFGVLLLEIISGKRNTSFYDNDHCSTLIGYAWKLWKAGSALELLDPVLGDTFPRLQLTRYINAALLCVQERASDRPTMSEVVFMLSNETAALPVPKQPAFFSTASIFENRTLTNPRTYTVNNVTISELEAR